MKEYYLRCFHYYNILLSLKNNKKKEIEMIELLKKYNCYDYGFKYK
jgi:hypothetical protein